MTEAGLVTVASPHPVDATVDRLAEAAAAAGLTVFARIDHAAGATQAGLPLRPTQLLLFGTAANGTPLMQREQTAGLDLPLRALAWEDADGRTWLTHDDAAWLARRHGLDAQSPEVEALAQGLARLAAAATAP
jgi:uncharacterized protein (DUF302 family)